MILVGDIGGTKTNVALFAPDGRGGGELSAKRSFPTARYDSPEALFAEFVAAHDVRLTRACFGVAGPVIDNHVRATNLRWEVDGESLRRELKLEAVTLINDLEATAYGIEALGPEQIHTLNEGDARRGGNRALIAAGTGLGMCAVVWHEGRYVPVASEGGHADFAPRNPLESEMFLHMLADPGFRGHVSSERVVSGQGLFNVYKFLRARGRDGAEPAWLSEEIAVGDAPAVIGRAALVGRCELAVKALDVFAEAYGAMAGNLALLWVATGGVYVGVGIAPKIIEKLKDGSFMRGFTAKGRFTEFAAGVPVRVILDPETALYGAARRALLDEA